MNMAYLVWSHITPPSLVGLYYKGKSALHKMKAIGKLDSTLIREEMPAKN